MLGLPSRTGLWLSLTAAVMLAGCNSTYSPPVRSGSFGSPAGVAQGQVEAGGVGHARAFEGLGGGPLIAVGVNDWLAFEGAYDWSDDTFVSGSAAARITLGRTGQSHRGLLFDFAIGGGGGRGGSLCDDREQDECPGDRSWDGVEWIDRPYGGGFADIGLGTPLRSWLRSFLRLRVQVTGAIGVPITYWTEPAVGLEATLDNRLDVHLALGYMARFNSHWQFERSGDYEPPMPLETLSFYAELGVTWRFSLTGS